MTDLQRIEKEIIGLRAKLRWDHVDHATIEARIEVLEEARRKMMEKAGTQ